MITTTELEELSSQVENANSARALAVKGLVKETRERQSSLWALFIGLFIKTLAQKKLNECELHLNQLLAKCRDISLQYVVMSSLQEIMNSPDGELYQHQVTCWKEAQIKYKESGRLLKLAENAREKLKTARNDCNSASSLELLDMFTTNKVVSVFSAMDTSSASSSLKKAMSALKQLADEMPDLKSSIDVCLPDDTLDLIVDLTLNPAIDILSWFNVSKLDNAEEQCSKALKKLQKLLGQLGEVHDLRTKEYQSQLETLKTTEKPYIRKVMRRIPENMKFKEPEYLQTIGLRT